MEEDGSISEDASKKDDPPSSVDVAPPVGILADYPYCVTPQQMVRRPNSASESTRAAHPLCVTSVVHLQVIPARGSSTVHVSFTPLTLPEAVDEDRCVGVALGFVRLSEVTSGVMVQRHVCFILPTFCTADRY